MTFVHRWRLNRENNSYDCEVLDDKGRWRIQKNNPPFDGRIPLGLKAARCKCGGDVIGLVDDKADFGVCWKCSAEVKL